MGPRPYRLVFYAESNGDEPVARWLRELPEVERYALGSAMDGLLQQGGPLLAFLRPQYCSSLGGGLYEFRLEDVTEELLRELGKRPRHALLAARSRNLFRVFFHPFGNRLLLLLAGYDKAKRPSATYQGQQIRLARKRLADWQRRQPPTRRRGT
ncbi:MAG: hypothetical protein ACYC8T_14135 [Myxococcaceae bacterium]